MIIYSIVKKIGKKEREREKERQREKEYFFKN